MGKTCRAPIMLEASGKRKAPTGSRFSTRTSNRLQPADRFSLGSLAAGITFKNSPGLCRRPHHVLRLLRGVRLYSQFNNAGEPQWLRVRRKAGDPLNLMRVMPPKGARVRCRTGIFSHAIFHAWFFVKVTNQENRNAGKQLFLISFFLLS